MDIFEIIICSVLLLALIRLFAGEERATNLIIGIVGVIGGCIWFAFVMPSHFFAKFTGKNFVRALIGLILPLIVGTLTGIFSERFSVVGAIFWLYVCHSVIWVIGSIIIISLNKEKD